MVEMTKNNLFWSCPRCGIINKWVEDKCTKCYYSLNQGLAMMVVAEALESRIDIDTRDGIYSFKKTKNLAK